MKSRREKVAMVSLGCPRNLTDAEAFLGRLAKRGHAVVDIEEADIAIVNTCAFIQDAKAESVDAILKLVDLKKEGRLKKIVVTGCLAQRYHKELAREIPEIDALVGAPALNRRGERFAVAPGHYAYLKIAEGCISRCSYCVIPALKGKFTSLKPQEILRQAAALDRQGVAELNLIGQDLTGYGMDLCGKPGLSRMLKQIAGKARRVGWLRLLYLYPSRIEEGLLDFVADEPRACKYLDVPLQHANDRILKLMRRGYAKKDIVRLVTRIRKKIPGVAIRTSFLAGFPSETEKEFRELLEFVKELRFERLGVFSYSREEGTTAASLPAQLPARVKEERLSAIMSAQQGISAELNRKFLGKTIRVLVDEKDKGIYLGRTQHDAPEVDGLVYVRSYRNLVPGEFVDVRITDALEYDLTGEVVS